MGSFCLVFPLGLLLVSGIAGKESATTTLCYSFDNGDEGWVNELTFLWKWSEPTPPVITDIPTFTSTSNYMWLQDIVLPPDEGRIISPSTISLNVGDTIESTIFRHCTDPTQCSSTIYFVTPPAEPGLIIMTTTETDKWTSVPVTCVDYPPIDPTTTALCCESYPCSGYFRAYGQIHDTNDLLAIDSIGVNGGCDSTDNTCCSFDTTSTLCGWSPTHVSNGWIWSEVVPNSVIESITTSGYIYVVDTSANVSSSILNVPDESTFTLNYYFDAGKYDTNNRVEAAFLDLTGTGYITYLSFGLVTTAGTFLSIDLPAIGLCQSAPQCDGMFFLATYNSPGVSMTVAIDKFSLNHSC